jgi:hypothetical protein
VAKRRETNIFNLAFLDVMACAFGATILLYNLVNDGSQLEGARVDSIRTAEVKK